MGGRSLRYPQLLKVCAFYEHKKADVHIVDLATIVPEFAATRDLLEQSAEN
jgi:hypothetical protein